MWVAEEPRAETAPFVWSLSGLALLAGVWGGAGASLGMMSFGLVCVLSGAVLFLSHGAEQGRRVGPVLPLFAALAVAGAPFTPGLTANRVLLGGVLASGVWWLVPLIVTAQAILVAGALRLATAPLDADAPPDPVGRLVHTYGLALPGLALLLAGVLANPLAALAAPLQATRIDLSAPTYWALGGFALTSLIGIGLWRFELDAQARSSPLWGGLAPVANLGWLYRLLWGIYSAASRLLLAIAGVLEGEGAVLWTLVVALLLWTILRSP